jgi:hypothetical protein
MPHRASPKREREYEELKQRSEHSGRYGRRAAEVPAPQIKTNPGDLSPGEMSRIELYDKQHNNRTGVMQAIEKRRSGR